MTSRPGRVPSTRSDSQPATHRANPRPDDMTRRKTAGRKTDGKDGRAQPLFAAARDQGHARFRLRRLRRSVANVHDGARHCTAGPVQHGLVRRRRRGGGLPRDRELGRRPIGRSLDRPAGPSSGVAAQPGGAHRGVADSADGSALAHTAMEPVRRRDHHGDRDSPRVVVRTRPLGAGRARYRPAASGLRAGVGARRGHLHRRACAGDAARHRGVPGVRVVVTAFGALGAVFGALEVSMVAFAGEQGARGAAGPLLAVLAGASLCAGVVYGARGWRAPLHRRFAVALGLLAVGVVPLAIVDSVPLMAAAAVLAGLAVSPSLISGYGLVERLSPSGALTEGLTWVSTAVGLGIAIGSSASGQLVDLRGAGWGFAVCLAVAAAAAVVGLSGHRVLRSAADPNPVLVPPAALEARAGRVGTASGTASSSSGRRS